MAHVARIVVLLQTFLVATSSSQFEIVYEWRQAEYVRPDGSQITENFNPLNNAIIGMKIWKDRMFLTVPRWKEGVPSTMNSVPLLSKTSKSPPLEPFPDFKMQQRGNCSAFQNTQSMEIDPHGRMWVIDVGRVNIQETNPDNTCPPKIVLIDLEDNNKILRSYVFPDSVASHTKSFLNDIVLDLGSKDDPYAYISDPGSVSIVVYSWKEDRSWKMIDKSMEPTILGRTGAVNGIAISPISSGARRLFYTPQDSLHIFSMPTAIAKTYRRSQKFSPFVIDHGVKANQTGGMAMDNHGILYFGLLFKFSVISWDTRKAFSPKEQKVLAEDATALPWPDTFAFDNHDGYLWFTTNRYNLQGGKVDPDEINYRVIRINTRSFSSLYPTNKELQGLLDGR